MGFNSAFKGLSYVDYHTPLHPTTYNNPTDWHHTTETFSLPTLFPI